MFHHLPRLGKVKLCAQVEGKRKALRAQNKTTFYTNKDPTEMKEIRVYNENEPLFHQNLSKTKYCKFPTRMAK